MKEVRGQRLTVNRFVLLTFVTLSLAFTGLAQTTVQTDFSAQAALVKEFDVNGLKVLVKRRVNSPTVVAGLFVRGGVKNVDAKTDGIENFMLEAASEGSKKYPRETLRRTLAATGGGIGAASTYDYSVLSLSSTRQNFDRSWDALPILR